MTYTITSTNPTTISRLDNYSNTIASFQAYPIEVGSVTWQGSGSFVPNVESQQGIIKISWQGTVPQFPVGGTGSIYNTTDLNEFENALGFIGDKLGIRSKLYRLGDQMELFSLNEYKI
jgi:hypothetical protein